MHLPNLLTKRHPQTKKSAFTLIELLIVISIIAILVAAATVSWSTAQKKARDGKRKSDLKSIQQALEIYIEENETYPADDGNGRINPAEDKRGRIRCDTQDPITWGNKFSCDDITYMNPIPSDPRGGTADTISLAYFYKATGSSATGIYLSYQISAGLENRNDPDACTSNCIDINDETGKPTLPCDPAPGSNYCVIQP